MAACSIINYMNYLPIWWIALLLSIATKLIGKRMVFGTKENLWYTWYRLHLHLAHTARHATQSVCRLTYKILDGNNCKLKETRDCTLAIRMFSLFLISFLCQFKANHFHPIIFLSIVVLNRSKATNLEGCSLLILKWNESPSISVFTPCLCNWKSQKTAITPNFR
jgi:hypothetical protein